MILHTLNKHQNEAMLRQCLLLAGPQDPLLLIEDGVYLALEVNQKRLDSAVTIYALKEDVAARGIQAKLRADVKLVDYAGFVTLCTTAEKVQAWF